MHLETIDHVALSVQDVERSAQWYVDVLGFERQHDDVWGGNPVFVGKGDCAIALFSARNNEGSKSPGVPSARILHFAFRANRSNFLKAQQELKEKKIRFEFQDHQISHSIYFSDPDGHEIEITTYELE
jgi:catechol 2,3-dioxygenase-like lactoylglutathione lyase family enzyme